MAFDAGGLTHVTRGYSRDVCYVEQKEGTVETEFGREIEWLLFVKKVLSQDIMLCHMLEENDVSGFMIRGGHGITLTLLRKKMEVW